MEVAIKLFHGSTVGGITLLQPRQADHDRPYIYMTTVDVVSAFYMCNAVEKPYYWFPYGFGGDNVPIYHELYPNALREVSEGKSGYLYAVEAKEEQVIPFKHIPCAWLGIEPIRTTDCLEVKNAYKLFQDYVSQGKLRVGRFEDKTEREMQSWHAMIYDYIKEKNMKLMPDCSYAKFIQMKFPKVWQKYLNENQEDAG